MTVLNGKRSLHALFPLFLAVLLPCVHLYSIRNNPVFDVPIIDSGEYVRVAGQIVAGSLFDTNTDHLSPLYTWFVALIFSVFGVGNLLAVKLFQILMNLGSAFLLYKIVQRIFSEKEAVVSLFLWAFYGPIIFFTCEIMSVPLILFFYNLSMYMVLSARIKNTATLWGWTGFVLGVSVLARPDILIFLLILLAMFFFSSPGKGMRFPEKRGLLAFFISGAFLPLVFMCFVNYSSSGSFRFLPEDSGLNFFIGNNPNSAKSIGARPGLFWDSLSELPEKEIALLKELNVDKNSIYKKLVWEYLHDDVRGFFSNICYKTLTLFNGYELPSTLDIYTFGEYSLILALLTWTVGWFSFPFGILAPVAGWGIWIARGKKECLWLLPMFFSFFISLIGFWNSSRYRMILIPLLIIFASVAVVYLYGIFSKRPVTIPWVPLGLCLAFTALCNLSYQHFSRNYNFDAEMFGFTGMHLAEREKKYEKALPRLTHSLDLQKQNENTCSGYPFSLKSSHECSDILASYQASLKGHTYLTLADIYLKRREFDKSSNYYNLAVQTGAVSFLAYNNLATLMMKQKKFETGMAYLRQSIELRPDYPVSHTNMGISLIKAGRPVEAVDEFAEVIRLGSESSEGFYHLALALVKAEFGRDVVVGVLKSLNIRQERALMVFSYMKEIKGMGVE